MSVPSTPVPPRRATRVALLRVVRLCLLIGFAPIGAAQSVTVPDAYIRALRAAGVPDSAAAVAVRPLDGPGIELAINDAVPMNPASTMKLVTTYAALHLLGPAYQWHTEALTESPIVERMLGGDLILRGSGDPSLVVERFWLLVQRLRALGIESIAGDLVLDRRRFVEVATDPAEFDGAPERPYNVAPDALLVNFKSVAFTFVPDQASGHARVVVKPALAGLRVPASVPLVGGRCGDWRARLLGDLSSPLAPAFNGGFPSACGEQSWYLSVLSHDD
jgi:serine-type D-Ala-D-Ala carboxypeptidase/endopeptidase (penicillin-binding protein 4)